MFTLKRVRVKARLLSGGEGLVMSVRSSIRPLAWNSAILAARIFMKFQFGIFTKIYRSFRFW